MDKLIKEELGRWGGKQFALPLSNCSLGTGVNFSNNEN